MFLLGLGIRVMLALEELVKNSCCLKEFVSRFLLALLLSEFLSPPLCPNVGVSWLSTPSLSNLMDPWNTLLEWKNQNHDTVVPRLYFLHWESVKVQCASACVRALVAQLSPTLCDPMDCSPPGFSVRGILQARVLEWIAIPFSIGTSQPRDRTLVSCITGRSFTVWAQCARVQGNRAPLWTPGVS